eukprot:3290489-Pleurochrysis_carterae.AAC.1
MPRRYRTRTAAEVAVDVIAAPSCAPPGCRAVIRATMQPASQLRPRASVCIKLVNSATIAARPAAAAVAVGLDALTPSVGEGDSSVSVLLPAGWRMGCIGRATKSANPECGT